MVILIQQSNKNIDQKNREQDHYNKTYKNGKHVIMPYKPAKVDKCKI